MIFILRVWNRTLGRKCQWLSAEHFRPIAKLWAKEIDANPIIEDCDYLFFLGGAQITPYMRVKKPVIYFSDATVHVMMDYYWHNINKMSQRMAMELETAACQNAIINIRSSQWAVDSVIKDCHVPESRCHVLEFGPNLDAKDIKRSQPYDGGELRLLFSGVDWNRKGGDIAVEIVEILRNKGMDARLMVAGPRTQPKSCEGKPYIEYVGYLNKNDDEQYHRYLELYEKAHVFLLPTRAECSATVYAEAATAGLPCYTYLTGGVGNYVINGMNGRALPEGAPAHDFAEQIIHDIQTGDLASFMEGATKLSREKLNWEVWRRKWLRVMENDN